MNYIKGKPEAKEEVRERDISKVFEQKSLFNKLKYYWEYSNNTSYNKQFRAHKLYLMVYWITHYLDNNQALMLKDECYLLLNLIRQISLFQIEKSADNKRKILSSFKELETLNQ